MGTGDREVEGVEPGALGGTAARAFSSRTSLARASALRSASAFALALAALARASASALALRRSTSSACRFWASAWASIRSAIVASRPMAWERPVSVTLADSVSAASAGEDSEPMTPVVARAAMPAARALRRVRRLGARCFRWHG